VQDWVKPTKGRLVNRLARVVHRVRSISGVDPLHNLTIYICRAEPPETRRCASGRAVVVALIAGGLRPSFVPEPVGLVEVFTQCRWYFFVI
jgi:hypothetical protein